MNSVCLSVCPSVCASSSSLKYSSNVLKFIDAISDIKWSILKMLCMELKVSYKGTQEFSETLRHMGRKFLKRITINLPPTKDNEINIFNADVQNHVPYTGSHKRFLIYYELCFETARNVFSMVFHSFKHFSTKLKNVYSVCLSVCAQSNSCKYSPNILKFMYAIHV